MNQLISRNMAMNAKRRESYKSSINDFSPDDFLVSGQFLISGSGEVLVDVNFPCSFEEIPLFSFGGAMEIGSPVAQGSFPTISAVVVAWNFTELPMKGSRIYKGATIAVVTTGASDQQMWINWHFTGHAFVNPVSNSAETSQTI